jgi:hypothetical protein
MKHSKKYLNLLAGWSAWLACFWIGWLRELALLSGS